LGNPFRRCTGVPDPRDAVDRRMIPVTPFLTLDPSELSFSFVRASGPGGQNVNKVATAVELRFDARRSRSLPDEVSIRLQALAGQKLTKDGVIVIQADRFRSQDQNRADAIDRLVALIQKAAVRPRKRIATKPTKGSQERRLGTKSRRGDVKKMRSAKPTGE
jgi:ribosome-associated protein